MPDYEQSVFISYAWGGDREDIVNEIDETLQQRGIRIVRDKRALGYRGSIKDFMERIGRGSCIIVVISDKYLRSPNCMFELVEIAENKQFHDRIFPVVLTDANIYDPLKRIEYIRFWEGKRKELAKAMKTLDPANLHGIREEMDQYDRIRDKISGITSILKDMNTLTPDMHRDSEFSNLYDAIVERLKEGASDVTTEFDEMAKKADREAKAEAERKAKEEADRIARAEANRLAARKAEEERLAIVTAEEERKAKEEADHLAAQKAEEDRLAAQKAEAERLAKRKADEELAAKVQADRDAKAEAERKSKEEADRLAAQKAESDRLAKQKAEEERMAKARADREAKAAAERKAREEAQRVAAQKAEAERVAKAEAEADRIASKKAEAERKAKEKIIPAPVMPAEIKAEPVAVAPAQKKPASKVMMYGIVAVVVLVIAGIGISALSRGGNNNTPSLTPTTNAAVIEPATEAPATPTTAADAAPADTATVAPTPTPVLVIGSTMISEKDGMTLLYVPVGEFIMGSNAQADEVPVHKVTLDAFWIDKTEVTNKMYALCVAAGACQPPADTTSSIKHSSYYGNSQNDNYPVIYVDWYRAKAYCEWAGRRLPTEAEWEKAARGTNGSTYPWGDDIANHNRLNFDKNYPEIGDTTEVGDYPSGASSYGALDMAGNVWEWVADWYSATYYASSPTSNPLGPSSGDSRVLRGSSWRSASISVRSAERDWYDPSYSSFDLGFRCAMGAIP